MAKFPKIRAPSIETRADFCYDVKNNVQIGFTQQGYKLVFGGLFDEW